MINDKELERLQKTIEERWSFDRIRSMTTDAIIKKLHSFNIPFDATTFLEDIKHYDSAETLAEDWYEKYDWTAPGLDKDFIWMAAIVLWERLAPDEINMEMINDLMQEGYELLETGETIEACDTWLRTWDYIKQKLTDEMTTAAQFDEIFRGHQCVFNWCQDFETELGNASLEDGEYYQRLIQYCQEFYTQFTREEELLQGNFRRAEADAFFALGDAAMGEKKYRELTKNYPNFPWGYTGWAAQYWLLPNVPKDYDKAEAIYLRALANPNLQDREYVVDYLIDLYEEKGDPKKAEQYRKKGSRTQ